MAQAVCSLKPKTVAVIGGGAAGLVATEIFSRSGLEVVTFESKDWIGGVWKYGATSEVGGKNNPMYSTLRTNLPKEIMAFNFNTQIEGRSSFITHADVHRYLLDFTARYKLMDYIQLNTHVVNAFKEGNSWAVETQEGESTRTHYFDALCVCNGHFDVPIIPKWPGQEYLEANGIKTMHSKEYDWPDPQKFHNQRILIVGGRSSGSDIARELSNVQGTTIHVSDRNIETSVQSASNIIQHPAVVRVEEDGSLLFSSGECLAVDQIVHCTGYEYSFPFLNLKTRNKFAAGSCWLENGRRLRGLYHHLFAAADPTLSFVGLPFSVVPFPLFSLQCEYIASVLRETTLLPPASERIAASIAHDEYLASQGRLTDSKYHNLGDEQWEYCRMLASNSGMNNLSTTLSYLDVIEAMYKTNQAKRPMFTGGPDSYRDCKYFLTRRQEKSQGEEWNWRLDNAV